MRPFLRRCWRVFPIGLVGFLIGCGDSGPGGGGEATPSCDPAEVSFSNLGVTFAPWNGVADSLAGSFKFIELGIPPQPLMGAFAAPTEKGPSFSLNFLLKDDSVLIAPGSGTVVRFDYQPDDEDYEIGFDIGGCQVSFDHVLNPTVALGDTVNAGDPVGNPGPWYPEDEVGIVELQVQAGDTYYCPLQFLTPEARTTIEASMTQLMEDIETLVSDTDTYDEAAMAVPGCYELVLQGP